MWRRIIPLGLWAIGPVWALAAVDWYAWTEQDLAKARAAGRSVYVFVGSELSELSRTTEKEIFGRPETAAWLNENFFCIRVDADQQPEAAAYAQHFINSARQLKGWPVHLWLTPELAPYEGANYLPPTEEWGRPGFLKNARSALEAWTRDPARARALAEEAMAQMSAPPPVASGPIDVEARLAKATEAWIAAADRKNGGFGSAPKLPEPELIRFLLKRGPEAQAVAIEAARAIGKGGLRDKDGGFFRRTIDAEWKEPYRQKLVSDQARIALALFEAADAAKDKSLRAAADGALRFVLETLRTKDGFAAAWDGTGEERGGKIVGEAPLAAEGLLIVALAWSEDAKLRATGRELASAHAVRWSDDSGISPRRVTHLATGDAPATASDLWAMRLGLRAGAEGGREQNAKVHLAGLRLERSAALLWDDATGRYLASRGVSQPGMKVRAPALPEPMPAEVLALLAGVQGEVAARIRRTLLAEIEYDELPSGAVLLALAESK